MPNSIRWTAARRACGLSPRFAVGITRLQNLRDTLHITREGVSLLGISDAAESIGLRSVGVKLTWQQLRDEANFPCIVHWNQRHFVVVYKIEEETRAVVGLCFRSGRRITEI